MKIRKYKPEDEKDVKEVIFKALCGIYGSTKIDWEDFSQYIIIYVAEEDEKIVGSVALKKVDEKMIKLKRMYVLPDTQRSGVGTKLLKKCIDFSKRNGFNKIILTTYPEMVNAVKFYEKNGFKIIKNPADYFFTNPKLGEYNKRQVAMEREI